MKALKTGPKHFIVSCGIDHHVTDRTFFQNI